VRRCGGDNGEKWRKKIKEKERKNRWKKIKIIKKEGYYGHFILLFRVHSEEKLFCQTSP
jgi:hypothetical protein